MAGLGLMDAVRNYREGIQWNQQQEQVARQQKQQQVFDEAQKAFGSVIEQSQAEAVRNGQDISQYRPSDATMLKAAERRGITFAKAGDWNSYLQNEAAVQKQRIRVRATALQKHQADGNTEELLRAVVPTIFDGNDLTKVETLPGGEPGALKGAPSGPAKIRFTLSNGVTKMMEPRELIDMVKMTLVDPEKSAQQEIEANFKARLAEIEAQKQIKVEKAKGAESRLTETQKAEHQRGLTDTKFDYDMRLRQAENASQEKIAAGNQAATRYSANQGLAGAKVRATTEKAGDQSAKFDWTDKAAKHFGQPEDGMFGKSGKADAKTLRLATSAREIYDANIEAGKKITPEQALELAAKVQGIK